MAALLLGSVTIAPSLHNGDALTAPEDSPLPAQAPQFLMQRQQGELSLTGHTSSLRHEQTLLNVAESSYPESQIVTKFQALGIVPVYWAESTVLLLKLLKYSNSAEAIMSPSELGIRSVIIDEPVWRNRLEEFREAMPADVAISSKTILVDQTIDISAICARASESFELGRINFEKSSVEFRGSAYPRLDRLIALANACYDSQILITGHTDSSGDEVWNQVLSRRRASAVGDYVTNGGISRDRLEVSGVGSEEPVADDSTRYGRSLNRRIDVEMKFND